MTGTGSDRPSADSTSGKADDLAAACAAGETELQ